MDNDKILSFDEWTTTINELEETLKEYERKIQYRYLQILGPCDPKIDKTFAKRSDEEKRVEESDLVLINIRKQSRDTRSLLEFVRSTGRLPVLDNITL